MYEIVMYASCRNLLKEPVPAHYMSRILPGLTCSAEVRGLYACMKHSRPLQVALHLIIPGPIEQGTQLSNGKTLKYKLTGRSLLKMPTKTTLAMIVPHLTPAPLMPRYSR